MEETKEEALDIQDENGKWAIMAACGHRVGGDMQPGDLITACPNCAFMASFGGVMFDIKYPMLLL